MTLKTQMIQDMIDSILNDSEFAEEIEYTPKGEAPKSIKAVIVRRRLDPAGEDQGRILQGQAEVFIVNDDTYGVTSVDQGNDEVSFPEIEGGAAISWVVIDVLHKDEGCWHLLVQK